MIKKNKSTQILKIEEFQVRLPKFLKMMSNVIIPAK